MTGNETRLIDITLADLKRIIAEVVTEQGRQMRDYIDSRMTAAVEAGTPDEPLKGIAGIAEALGCSKSKAQHLKSEGLLEGGYKQIGKTILVSDPRKLRDVVIRNTEARKSARRRRVIIQQYNKNHEAS